MATVAEILVALPFPAEEHVKTLRVHGRRRRRRSLPLRGSDRLQFGRLARALGVAGTGSCQLPPERVREELGLEPGGVCPLVDRDDVTVRLSNRRVLDAAARCSAAPAETTPRSSSRPRIWCGEPGDGDRARGGRVERRRRRLSAVPQLAFDDTRRSAATRSVPLILGRDSSEGRPRIGRRSAHELAAARHRVLFGPTTRCPTWRPAGERPCIRIPTIALLALRREGGVHRPGDAADLEPHAGRHGLAGRRPPRVPH